MNKCDGCTVNCCRCFTLGHADPAWLETNVGADAIFAKKHFTYLGAFTTNPLYSLRVAITEQHFYKCNLVTEDGKCSDYENRPPLCKGYGVTYAPDKDCLLYPEWETAQSLQNQAVMPPQKT